MFNGLGMNMGNLSRLSDAKTRSVCAENPTGGAGQGGRATEGLGQSCARDLGVGWKVSPCVAILAGETFTLADIEGPGAIQHIWAAPGNQSRFLILRIYWEDSEQPSVEVPVGDFFASAYPTGSDFTPLNSLAVCVNPNRGVNCYWEMPFRHRCRMTLENISSDRIVFYYQIDYTLTEVPEDCAYFHAQFRRSNPLPYKEVHTVLDGVEGKGQYVGTYLAWGVNNTGWWGEGEIKFYIDDDREFPTICGTGTEDYFGGAYNFDVNGRYKEFSTPYSGLAKVIRPDGLYNSQQRFSMYRWHIADPIRFDSGLRVTIQALGWRSDRRYLPLQDDISSTAFWYQTLPSAKFPPLPPRDALEII